MLTESLFRREPEISVGYILHYNLLYKFVQNIEVPHIKQLLLTLFKTSEHAKDVSEEAYRKLLRYCSLSQFFPDLSQAILQGWKAFEANKFSLRYKPPGVENLISIAFEASDKQSREELSSQESIDIRESILSIEKNGFKIDIDNLKPILENEIDFNKEEFIQAHTYTRTTPKLKQKRYSNFPSLSELSSKDESISEEIRTNENTRPKKFLRQNTIFLPKVNDNSTPKKVYSLTSLDSVPKSFVKTTKKPTSLTSLDENYTNTVNEKLKKIVDSKTSQGIMKKIGRYTHTEKHGSSQEGSEHQRAIHSVQFLEISKDAPRFIRQNTKSNKKNSRPIQRALHKEFDVEILDKQMIEELDRLYPTTFKAKTPIELEASEEEFNVVNLRTNDHFPLALCEFLEALFRQAVSRSYDAEEIERRLESGPGVKGLSSKELYEMKRKYMQKRTIGALNVDYGLFWQSVMGSGCTFFENLMKVISFTILLEDINFY